MVLRISKPGKIGPACRCRYHRVEVLGALASVLSIWLVTGILVYEAVNRILNPVPVNGKSATLRRAHQGLGARKWG